MLLCGFIYSQNSNHSLELEQANEEYFELNAPFFESYWYGSGDHNQFSIMCWVKIKENSIDEQVIFLHQTSGNFDIKLSIDENELRFYLNASGNEYVLTHFIDSVNCWNHITISSECQSLSDNPSTVRLYINGDYKNQVQILNDINWNSNLISEKIGGEGSFNGYIDDFSVWNISLNENNINSIINDGISLEDIGLIGFWNFDLSTEDLINNNDGQLVNGASFSSNTTNNLMCGSCLNDTSSTNITTCESYEWNGTTYTESGTYSYSELNNNELSMSFDGSGNTIETQINALQLSGGTSFTVSSWVKLTDDNNYFGQGILSNFNPSNCGIWFGIVGTESTTLHNHPAISFVSSPGLSISGPQLDNYNLSINTWTHLCVVVSSTEVKWYINGILIEIDQVDISNLSFEGSPPNLKIGQGNPTNGFDQNWNGNLDGVGIWWGQELTEQEINDLYSCGYDDNTNALGYWNFEQGEGETVIDLSGNGNDGTINGATYSSDVPEQSCQLSSVNGCDSVAVLNLTINQSGTSITNVTACESYEWNGEIYTESGTYEYQDQNENGYSMSFDGDGDYLFLGNADEYNFGQGDFSLQAWIKPYSNDQNSRIIAKGETSSQGTYQLNILNDKLRISFHDEENLSSENVIESGVWQHIAITRKNDSVFGFVNGIEVLNFINYSNLTSNQSLVFGYEPGYSSWFNGLMNDISIWDISLSQEEIQDYMNCIPSGNEEGLVGFWNFEEAQGSTVYDLSGSGNDGVINGATYIADVPEQSCQLTTISGCDSVAVLNLTITQPDTSFTEVTTCESYEWNGETYTESGVYEYSNIESDNNYSMSFNGEDNFIEFDNDNIFNLNTFTFTFWFKTDEMPEFANYKALISKGDGYGFRVGDSGGGGGASFTFYVNKDNDDNAYVYSYDNISDDNWHFVAGTRDGITGEIKLYIDYNFIGSSFGEPGQIDVFNSLKFGKYWNINPHYFNGEIDNISLWNIVLDSSEIVNYGNCSPIGNEEGLIGYWNFDDGIGNSVYDLSGNGNDGIINGASYSTNTPNQYCQLTTVNGCDSVAVLDLIITQPDTSHTTITACESYEWNGTTYTSSGTYSYSVGAAGNNNYSMNFDGNQSNIELPQLSPDVLNVGGKSTLILDYKGFGGVFAASVVSSPVYPIIFRLEINDLGNGLAEIKTYHRSTNLSVNQEPTTIPFVYDGNTWSSLAVTIDNDSGQYILYNNGVKLLDYYFTPSSFSGSLEWRIGDIVYNNGGTNYFNGNIDNLSLWNKVLDSLEISSYINCPPLGSELDLYGFWNFEQGSGAIVYDQTSNGNNGIINGATYSTDVPEQSCQLTTTNGCDSTAVLNLTINQPDTSFTDISACESYEWNGTTYTESGTYEVSYQNTNDNFSIDFNGQQDYIQFDNFGGYSNNFSVSADIKLNSESSSPQAIFSGGCGDFTLDIVDGYLRFYKQCNGSTTTWSNTYLNIGEWYNVTAAYAENIVKLYINGNLDVSQEQFWSASPNSFLTIGNSYVNTEYQEFFNGKIDNVQLWEIPLDEQQINEQLNCPSYVNNSGLVGFWNFEEGDGITVYDLSGNNNYGTIIGATYSTDTPEQSCPLTTVNGCDSSAVLNLTILNSNTGVDTQFHCDTYTWIDGNTYTSSNNTATWTLTNAAGCDSVVTLDLTINNSNTGVDTQTACDTYTWIDGITYTSSNNK